MFVQSSHFIERAGRDPMKRVTIYGHEKNETTASLAQINLAVNGLEGKIRAGDDQQPTAEPSQRFSFRLFPGGVQVRTPRRPRRFERGGAPR